MRYVLLAICVVFPRLAFAHSGGLDANGGHRDRKNGGYHYHRGGPSTSPSPLAALPQPRTTVRTTAPVEPRTTPRLAVREPQDEPVWVSRADEDYHLRSCLRLIEPARSMTLADVVDQYVPCDLCKPPVGLRAIVSTDDGYAQARQQIASHILAARQAALDRKKRAADAAATLVAERRERAAAADLRMAKQLMAQDRLTGKRWLKNLVSKFPGTEAASQAEALIARID